MMPTYSAVVGESPTILTAKPHRVLPISHQAATARMMAMKMPTSSRLKNSGSRALSGMGRPEGKVETSGSRHGLELPKIRKFMKLSAMKLSMSVVMISFVPR